MRPRTSWACRRSRWSWIRGSLRASSLERLLLTVPLLKERASTFSEARAMLSGELACLFEQPALSQEILGRDYDVGASIIHLEKIETVIAGLPRDAPLEDIKSACMSYADSVSKEDGGRGAVLWPLRYVLSGAERSPDPFTLIHILGINESVERIQKARKSLIS